MNAWHRRRKVDRSHTSAASPAKPEAARRNHIAAEIVVVGSGIAGLSFALDASEIASVVVVTKKRRADSNTNYAQGGIAAVVDGADSPYLHARDTLVAGAGLCHRRAVLDLVREGPGRVRALQEWGVRFTRSGETLSLGREGGHSRRRILHAGDLTGQEIERALLQALAVRPNVRLLEDHIAIDLRTGLEATSARRRCTGLIALDHVNNAIVEIDAAVVFLATGGFGQVYLHTTNPDIATGDGLAMAYRAGAALANLEFVQFHPTALHPAGDRAFLISEAVRGEGAILRTPGGEPLMEGVHALGSLAPRDVVARTIDIVIKETGAAHVWLDLSPIQPRVLETRFPGILAECRRRGFSLPGEPLPVVPAAHYACGGILTDGEARTSIPGLFAAGEVACTGVHGANRLASNSLLEAVVYSHRAARRLVAELADAGSAQARSALAGPAAGMKPLASPSGATPEAKTGTGGRDGLRRLMWDEVGIVRSMTRMRGAAATLAEMRALAAAGARNALNLETIEFLNLVHTASLVVACARRRCESRGLHYTIDHPHKNNERFLRDTMVGGADPEEALNRWESPTP
ncbi:MAG: L-aspartate oxidase [Longimicrobiales bacterium]